MKLYKVTKWVKGDWCYVTPREYIEYKKKWWVKVKTVESRPWVEKDKKDDNDDDKKVLS